MALFYSDKFAKKATKSTARHQLHIQDLDYQGYGIAKLNGKTWFVENALPDELVEVRVLEEKRQYGKAQAVKILQKSANRQQPSCPIYQQCGGCQMQHIALDLQRVAKQKVLIQRLQKLQTPPIQIAPMITGEAQLYRRRAKLHLNWQNNQLLLGFRQAQSQQIINVSNCEVLEPELSALLQKLHPLFNQWKSKKQLGHIELVKADNGVALLLRHVGEVSAQDKQKLLAFAEIEKLMLFVMQDKDQIEQWRGEQPYYQFNGLKLHFSIRDFIQVNAKLNEKMVEKALEWLDLSAHDRVLDLFCGMGNFTLPIAQKVQTVVGIEGVMPMVEQATLNAEYNQLDNAKFYQTDLDQPFVDKPWAKEKFNKVLLDPARNGAYFALDHLCQLEPERIVYVSCNPATLVRDAEKLIAKGYILKECAMIDMFPHTGHLESMLLFTRNI